MRTTDWGILKIRRALNRYRKANRRGRRPATWKAIHIDILTSTFTTNSFPEDGSKPAFREEALRRFGKGVHVLEDDKLADVKAFLIHKGALRESELDGDEHGWNEFVHVHNFLANEGADAKARISALLPAYVAQVGSNLSVSTVTLSIARDLSGTYVRVVEEIVDSTKIATANRMFYERDKSKMRVATRRGFGFVTAPVLTLHIFLRSYELAEDRITYIQQGVVTSFDPGDNPVMYLCLARYGEMGLTMDKVSQLPESQSPLFVARNVCEFVPEGVELSNVTGSGGYVGPITKEGLRALLAPENGDD